MTSDELRCGGCGCKMFTLYTLQADRVGGPLRFGGGPFDGTLVTVCQGCQSETKITMLPPRMDTREFKGDGIICGGWNRE